jgi:EAL domain-containing protein (putative c-di-GMP-specific phosphodiesterase class I)
MTSLFTDFSGRLPEYEVEMRRHRQEIRHKLRSLIKEKKLKIVYQPIFRLDGRCIIGYEALSRFQSELAQSPNELFNIAAQVGLRKELELAAMEMALEALGSTADNIFISINVSPETILSGAICAIVKNYPLNRIMLELTEHASIEEYSQITHKLMPLRKMGVKLGIDAVGAGYASFRHVLRLNPNVIKLDRSLIRSLDTDTGCGALVLALLRFADEMGINVIAGGVETEAELRELQ